MPISGPTAATAEATATETPPESSQSQEKDAKKVAADMERWAKKRKREEEKAKKIKLSLKRPAEQLTNPDASAPAPEETTPSTGGWVFEPESASDATAQHLEAQSASDADTDEVQLPEDAILLARYSKVGTDPWELAQGRGHIDISQGTCLLCQRGLGSEEKLEKHVRGSKLHATNLTEARDSIIAALSAAQKDAFERAVREASYVDDNFLSYQGYSHDLFSGIETERQNAGQRLANPKRRQNVELLLQRAELTKQRNQSFNQTVRE